MFNTVFIILEIVGTIAFAISGAMTAINRRLDALGVIILGVVTACGGGLLRDIMLGVFPQSLFIDSLYVIMQSPAERGAGRGRYACGIKRPSRRRGRSSGR